MHTEEEEDAPGMLPMNLFMPGEGLFDTHVTWEDIQRDMQRELSTMAFFGPSKYAKDIGEGKAFMSKIVLIHPDWQKNKDVKLPEKFLVKIATPLPWLKYTSDLSKERMLSNDFCKRNSMINFEAILKRAHNAEVAVYEHLAKQPGVKLNIPIVYFANKLAGKNKLKGYILMEYLEDVKQRENFEEFSIEEVKQFTIRRVMEIDMNPFATLIVNDQEAILLVCDEYWRLKTAVCQILRYKATLEAAFLSIPPKRETEFFEDPFQTLCTGSVTDKEIERVFSMLPAKAGSKLASQRDQLRTILPKVIDLKWADNLAFKCELRRVLCHGDLCPSNTLWRKSGEGSELVAVLDYQTAHFGCAATDLLQIFVMFLSGEDRRSHWEELTEEFYEYLRKQVGQRRMPYTLEQVKEAYLQFFPTGAITLLPFIAPLFKLINENVQDKQKKKEFLDRLTEKTECLLEDLLNCYERNAMTHKKKQSA